MQSGGSMRLALRHGLSACISSRVHVQIHVVHDRGIAIYMKAYAVHVSPPPPPPLPTHAHTQLPTDRVNPNVIESTPTTPQVTHLYYANTPTAHHRQAMKTEANATYMYHLVPLVSWTRPTECNYHNHKLVRTDSLVPISHTTILWLALTPCLSQTSTSHVNSRPLSAARANAQHDPTRLVINAAALYNQLYRRRGREFAPHAEFHVPLVNEIGYWS